MIENLKNINRILHALPHRYPMLMVDRVLEILPNQSIKGIKNVTYNEPQFTGHFPEMPIMPGVLIIEAMAQLSGILAITSTNSTPDNKVIYFMSIEKTKFRRMVTPGDSMIISSKVDQQHGNVWKFNATAEVGGAVAADSTFTATIRDKEQ